LEQQLEAVAEAVFEVLNEQDLHVLSELDSGVLKEQELEEQEFPQHLRLLEVVLKLAENEPVTVVGEAVEVVVTQLRPQWLYCLNALVLSALRCPRPISLPRYTHPSSLHITGRHLSFS
jgi:hypothetical protein